MYTLSRSDLSFNYLIKNVILLLILSDVLLIVFVCLSLLIFSSVMSMFSFVLSYYS